MTNQADTVADSGDPDELPPLTRNGYTRRPETIAQIRRALPLSRDEVLQRLRIRDEAHADYIGPEAMVFLIRRHLQDNDQRFLDRLLESLIARCIPVIFRDIRGFEPDARNDIRQDTLESLVRRLLRPGNGSDFAQVSFWSFLKKIRLSACAKHIAYVSRTDQLDDRQADALAAETDYELSPEQRAQLGEGWHALEALPAHLRKVFVMRHYFGFKLGPEDRTKEDPDDPSLAAHFGKTPRTIQNWLSKANELLARFQKD